jgi:hypothetical protein
MAEEAGPSTIKLKPSTLHRLQDFAASVGRPATELAEEAIDRWGLLLLCCCQLLLIKQQSLLSTQKTNLSSS